MHPQIRIPESPPRPASRAVATQNADVVVRVLGNPHIIVSLFRALDNLQPHMDRAESDASGTARYQLTHAAVQAARDALNEAKGQS